MKYELDRTCWHTAYSFTQSTRGLHSARCSKMKYHARYFHAMKTFLPTYNKLVICFAEFSLNDCTIQKETMGLPAMRLLLTFNYFIPRSPAVKNQHHQCCCHHLPYRCLRLLVQFFSFPRVPLMYEDYNQLQAATYTTAPSLQQIVQ